MASFTACTGGCFAASFFAGGARSLSFSLFGSLANIMFNNDIAAGVGVQLTDACERFFVTSGVKVWEGGEDTALLEA